MLTLASCSSDSLIRKESKRWGEGIERPAWMVTKPRKGLVHGSRWEMDPMAFSLLSERLTKSCVS